MWKVGQDVWCVLSGKGKVVDASNSPAYPVYVKFDNGNTSTYTAEGKYSTGDVHRCLFFSEPKIEGATTPPFEPTLGGKKVIAMPKLPSRYAACGPLNCTQETAHWVFTNEGSFDKSVFNFHEVV